MKIVSENEHLEINRCFPDPENANRMAPDMVATLAGAIQRLGFTQPVLVRSMGDGTYRVIDGHHRMMAAQQAGLDAVPGVVVDCSDAEARALQLGMNRLRGEVDLVLAAKQVTSLFSEGWQLHDVLLTGFSSDEVDALLRASTPRNDDDPLKNGLPAMIRDEDAQEEDEEQEKAWALEVCFDSKETLERVKRALKKHAGKGGDMADGLLSVLGLEEA